MGQLEGMVPEGVRSLKDALNQAEVSLDAIGEELWAILRKALLPTASADTILRAGAWAGGQGPEINKRLILLERMELADPELFGSGKPPISVDESLLAPGAVLPTTGGSWDRIGQELQARLDPNLNSGDGLSEQVKGAVESVVGLGEMAIDFSLPRAIVDFMGWQRDVIELGRSLASAIDNPVEFVKAAVDWETWATNPNRAFGRLIPDIVATATTAGSSSVASAATRTVGALGKAAKAVIPGKPSVSSAPRTPRLHIDQDGGPTGTFSRQDMTTRPSDITEGNGPPSAPTSTPPATGGNPLDDALRHTSNAEGRAWARDSMPLPDLAPEELRALRDYGGPGYMKINAALRAKATDPDAVWAPELTDEIAAMDRAIAKSHLPTDVVLHRGVGNKFLEAIGVDINSLDDMEAMAGTVITEPGYLSTSVGRRAGFDGDVRLMLRAPKGHEALNMYPITELIGEREILLRRGTSYIVRDVYRKNGQWYMEADVVPDGWIKPPDWDAPPSMDADLGWEGPYDD
ncbi:ADP-ribosyltransferase exoenzyme [Nonomuraea maritima]|uniref:ADP-ribosyltransferase exoenzyme n=1 Tax=Nonomuraea maritima TaxID=683260 RepID=A0A1G9S8L6_9ACTN|nr:ADP-ribosyltransferase [Nonomuraea maritima]SDM31818.1 ADP-ribosyltransferase exoenzyme [Nonomuraea maritima]